MKRRDFVTSVLGAGLAVPIVGHNDSAATIHDEHAGHGSMQAQNQKPLRDLEVSFGHWGPSVATPFDRFTNGNDRTRNVHQIIPNPIRVHAGDSISFIVSGFHNVQIFGPGTQPADIDRTKVLVATGFPPIIDDSNHRVYRGVDPRGLGTVVGTSQDRVEVVALTDAGRFLVLCGVLPHFFDAPTGQFVMFGFINVEPADD
jgi:hypothetical protein